MADKKIPDKENAASVKDRKGPADPGVKVDAGEEHHLKQAAALLNEPDETDTTIQKQREDQPLRHVNDTIP